MSVNTLSDHFRNVLGVCGWRYSERLETNRVPGSLTDHPSCLRGVNTRAGSHDLRFRDDVGHIYGNNMDTENTSISAVTSLPA